MYDANKKVLFESFICIMKDGDINEVLFCENRRNNVYFVTTNNFDDSNVACLSAIDDQTNLWHRRAGYLHH